MNDKRFKPLLDRQFLKAELDYEYRDYVADGIDNANHERLKNWAKREVVRETQAEGAFVQRFFVETWGYREDGTGTETFHLKPKFNIAGAGQTGHRGEADLAVGHFGANLPEIPQIVCEFKHITKAGLDAPQNRKGNNRSPVQQAQDYLWGARRGIALNATVQARFAIVTDMNEFRLYWSENMPDRYIRFKIDGGDLFDQISLLGESEDSRFDRFLFWRLFRPDMLLSDAGRTRLERLIERQGKVEKKLEDDFYEDYRGYREVLIRNIMLHRPEGVTRSGAVRLGQKLLDRLIFLMFAEDMGQRVGFPANELQHQLTAYSRDSMLEGNGSEVWTRLKLIFSKMNEGGAIGDHAIHRFNGGLFADDAAINALNLPNHIFVRRGQAQNDAKLAEHKQTLLYLAATYNFAKEGDAKNSIGLYTLGHIFEQSIVELEKLEADAEDRLSLTDITKRKRDGVYYTPEWAVRQIIEQVIDPLFAKWKAEAGWPEDAAPTKAAAKAYWDRLQTIKVIDPACGSGAFLIVALGHLEREFAAAVEAAVATKAIEQRPDDAAITEMILTNNLFGVDINPASVEITRLSLWLHTARANKPLSSLEKHIECGNSLVDKRFYAKRKLYDDEGQDRINTFEWAGDFAAGSFDAVIGNPPYVKLQNFVKVNADMAAWLTGAAPYASTKTGNFDLYLPFIEKGLDLLNDGGRMGYIAPNLWPTLEYGEGLRGLIHKGRHLEKWLDFRSFQVFEEATVYTAIQIFSKAPVEAVRLAFAGDGDISKINWVDDSHVLPYAAIQLPLKPWLIAPTPVRTMIERLGKEALRLDQPENSMGIIVGIQTSADHIYHLKRLGKNRYSYMPRQGGKKLAAVLVEIEDAIMKPLVSGAEAKRFLEPRTDTYLLFPYRVNADSAKLLTADEMAAEFPKAWAYLKGFEKELRARDSRKNDNDEKWFGYIYPKNLDKQQLPKLLVPRLVANLGCFVDDKGIYYCDNVDVGGVVPARVDDIWFLAGVLNAPVTNTIFGWLTKPFRGDYKSANKQFIAPLPVPKAKRNDKAALSSLAQKLQEKKSEQVEERLGLEERLAATTRVSWPLEKLLSDVRPITEIEADIPKSVPATARKAWVDEARAAQEEAALSRIDGLIRLDSDCTVTLAAGKLSFLIDEQAAASVFVTDAEAALIEAQWRCVALDFAPTGKGDAKRLIDRLRKVATTAEPAIVEQIIAIGQSLGALSDVLRDDEAQLHEMTCRMFNLTPAERLLVERARGRG
jgi:Eco57I restriction-modification methylase